MRLRGFEAADFERHLEIKNDPRVQGHLPATDREELWRRTVSGVGNWQVCGFGMWMVERGDDRRLLGSVGFFVAPRSLEPSFEGQPEMGYMMAPEVHGQGMAREACEAALTWLDDNVALPCWAIIDPDNAPSHRLAERLGFIQLTTSLYRDEPIDVLRRPAP